MVANIIIALVSAIVGIGLYIIVTTYITKNTIKKQCAAALKEAEAEGEMIKKEKILQAKETTLPWHMQPSTLQVFSSGSSRLR